MNSPWELAINWLVSCSWYRLYAVLTNPFDDLFTFSVSTNAGAFIRQLAPVHSFLQVLCLHIRWNSCDDGRGVFPAITAFRRSYAFCKRWIALRCAAVYLARWVCIKVCCELRTFSVCFYSTESLIEHSLCIRLLLCKIRANQFSRLNLWTEGHFLFGGTQWKCANTVLVYKKNSQAVQHPNLFTRQNVEHYSQR